MKKPLVPLHVKALMIACGCLFMTATMVAGNAFGFGESPAAAELGTAYSLSAKVDKLKTDVQTLQTTIDTYVNAAKTADTDIQYVIRGIDMVDKIATDLKTLDQTMTDVDKLLDIAKAVPQTRDQAQALKDGIATIHPQVSSAAKTAARVDTKLQPIGEKLDTLDVRLQQFVKHAQAFQKHLNDYVTHISNAQDCINSLPAGPAKEELQSKLDALASMSDQRVVQANTILQKIITVVTDITTAIETKIKAELEPLATLDENIEKLLGELSDLVNPLHELSALLDKSFGTKFPYPTWKGIKWYHLSISMRVIIQGAGAIEDEIERILGKAMYKFAKIFGLDKLIKDLVDQGDRALKDVMKDLHMDFKVEIPGLDKLETDLQALETDLEALEPKLNIDFGPLESLFEQIEDDMREVENIYDNCHKM